MRLILIKLRLNEPFVQVGYIPGRTYHALSLFFFGVGGPGDKRKARILMYPNGDSIICHD